MVVSVENQNDSAGAPEKRTVTSICGICPGGCGVNVELVDGKIERVAALKGHPIDIVCVRGAHAKEIVYSPDRLKYPLARVGARGEGRFARVSWDEAMEGIARKMLEIKEKYGPQAMAMHIGRGCFDESLTDLGIYSLLFPFGSPNMTGVSSLCYNTYGVFAAIPTLGTQMRMTYSDFERSQLIVAWGANPATDSPPIDMRRISQAKAKGAKVIAIDHRRSDVAGRADQWIPIRPGTDGALALSMMNVIIAEKLYDADFVRDWTVGFAELSDYVKQFPPEAAERITGVPRETIAETARAIASARHASFSMYTGLEYTNSGVQNIRAVYILWAITGNLDVPGGIVFRARKAAAGRRDIDQPTAPKPIGYDKYPYFCTLTKRAQFMEAPRAILHDDPYPLRGILLNGSSIITSYPNPKLWQECFSRLDLLVVMDRFMTADGAYADYVLPATTYYENLSYQRYSDGSAQLRQRVIEPVGEARSDHYFCAELARRLGYGHLFPQTENELLEFAFKDSPFTVQQLKDNPAGIRAARAPEEYRKYEHGSLRPDGKPGFNTASGKIELAASLLAKYGFDALPVYVEPVEGPLGDPELAKRYPLVLNTGARLHSTFRSQHLNIPGLLKMQAEPQAILNVEDAAARGIQNGDKVQVETARGRVAYTAQVTDGIVKGAVEVNVGGGGPLQPPAWREANTNYLTDFENRDPISGFPIFKALLCEVRKI